MKSVKSLVFGLTLVLFVVTLMACNERAIEEQRGEETYIIFDINPSFEVVTNHRDRVIAVHALNEDAELLLIDLELIGLSIEDAIEILIDAAIELGFIDPDADEVFIDISVLGIQEMIQARVRAKVEERINQALQNRMIPGQAREKVFAEAFRDEAAAHGVTPQEYRLILSAMIADPELTIDEALLLTHEELIAIVRQPGTLLAEGMVSLREDFLVAKEAIREEYMPLIQALYAAIEEAELNEEPTEALIQELRELRLEMQAALQVVIQSFIQESATLRESIFEARQARIEAHRQAVEDFKERVRENLPGRN